MAGGSVDYEREQQVFNACLALTPPERAAYLERTCVGDAALQERVERLLVAHERAEQETLHPLRNATVEDLPDIIGPYRLDGVLGEGGMGVVYDAEQLEPVRRRVALKVVKLGMDTRQVVGRFMAERQALASLDHPYVAKVFEAGQTVSGRPYFVMERVDGVPLTEYCERHQLTIPQRVELLALVCQAVQHAHQKGVIHRDLKPSNILVSTSDGAALPKIIDFGIAKAVGLEGPATLTEYTRADQALGTPAYMSPEQAGRGGLDVDTRTDVYSLGVVLYEVLTGHLPADPVQTGYPEFLAALARGEIQPARPSTRAASRQLKGDLDWICMKALEVDRTRRYDTVGALAEDLRRHLLHEPVLAGPPSRTYRLRRLVRRNRSTVAAAAATVIALVAGAAVAATQAVRATRAERAARADAETARQVSDFMVGLFEVSDPMRATGGTVTARELLDRGAGRIHGDLESQPLVRARVETVIGDIYRKLGLYQSAWPLLEEAVATRERLLGPNDPEVVRSLHALGRLRFDAGDRAGAEEVFREALKRVAAMPRPDRVAEARLQCELATALREKARHADSEALFRQATDTLARELGPTHKEVGSGWNGVAAALHFQGRFPEAEAAYRKGLGIVEQALGPENVEVAGILANLANTVGRQGRDPEAETYLRRALGVFEKAYGPRHPSVANTLGSLSGVYGRQGRLDEAIAMLQRSLPVREAIYGADHPEGVVDLKNLGLTYMLKGDYEAARQALERNLAVERKALGPDHPRVAWTEARLGGLHLRLGRLDEAEAAYRRALSANQKALGPEHVETATNLRSLGEVATRRGRLEEAEGLLTRAVATLRRNASHPDLPGALNALAELRRRQGRLDEARVTVEEALALQRKMLRPGHPALAETLVRRADVLAAQGRPRDAEPSYREALTVAEKAHGPGHPDVARALHGLGVLLGRIGGRAEAAALLQRALAIRRERLGKAHPDSLETARAYARATR
jgi:serine/threonine protein kinase/tetratricopeptide (TPR) repeat protein